MAFAPPRLYSNQILLVQPQPQPVFHQASPREPHLLPVRGGHLQGGVPGAGLLHGGEAGGGGGGAAKHPGRGPGHPRSGRFQFESAYLFWHFLLFAGKKVVVFLKINSIRTYVLLACT